MRALIRAPMAFIRLAYQSVYLALGQIWANKSRSILTTIGIVIGVASVTAVIAALTGLKAKVLTQVETLGTNSIFIQPRTPKQVLCNMPHGGVFGLSLNILITFSNTAPR